MPAFEPEPPAEPTARPERLRTPGAQPALVVVADDLPADLGSVDALARLALEAQRGRRRVRILGASPELEALVELSGLARILRCATLLEDASAVEPEG